MLPSSYDVAKLLDMDARAMFELDGDWRVLFHSDFTSSNVLAALTFLLAARNHAVDHLERLLATKKPVIDPLVCHALLETLYSSCKHLSSSKLATLFSDGHFYKRLRQVVPDIPMTYLQAHWMQWPPVRRLHLDQGNQHLLTDPYALINHAYSQLATASEEEDLLTPVFLEPLILFMLGLVGIFPRNCCQLCFRHAVPQEHRCRFHTQDSRLRGPSGSSPELSTNAAAAQKGRVVTGVLDSWDGYLPMEISSGEDADLCTLASCLWGPTPYLNHRLLEQIDTAYSECPLVRELLPTIFTSLSPQEKIDALRQALDPQEFDTLFWGEKLYISEEWLTILASKSPGRLQRTTETLANASLARSLISQGKSNVEIARALGKSRSYVTHLLKRVPEP